MKVKFGWVVGVNVAAACLLMQGCKAPRVTGNNYGNDIKSIETTTAPAVAPADDIRVSDAPAPKQAAVPAEQAPVAPVPATAPAPVVESPAAQPAYTLYTVKPGDMLSKISKRYNIRQKAILDLNPGLSPNKLYAGKKIKLPGNVVTGEPEAVAPVAASPAPVAASAASVSAPKAPKAAKYTGATKEYVVKSGDSLGKIAYDNGTNVRTLKEINGLKGDRVFIGQKLKVPAEKTEAKAKPFAKKAEAKADAKAEPAKKAEAKTEAKKSEVKAADDKKTVPAEAKAPAAAAEAKAPEAAAPAAEPAPVAVPEPAAAAPAPAAAPAAAIETHTVKEGEDVVSIAISYGVSPSALMDANDLKSSEVKPGDILKIPAKSAQ